MNISTAKIASELMLFSERKAVADAFIKWAEENGMAQTPMSVVTYLYANGLLDVGRCRRRMPDEAQ